MIREDGWKVISVGERTLDAERSKDLSSTLDAVIVLGLAALLMFAVLALGAVEPWSLFVLEAGVAGLFGLWAWRQVVSSAIEIHWNPLYAPIALFALAPLAQLVAGRTAYRYETYWEVLRWTACALAFFVADQTLRTRSLRRLFVFLMTGFGGAVALFGIIHRLTSNGKLYWVRALEFTAPGGMFGPYANHNHFAGLMEMLVPLGVVMALDRRAPGTQRALLVLASVIMASSIFLSLSRGGIISFLAQIVFLSLVLARRGRRKIAIAIGVFALIAVIVALSLGGTGIGERVASALHLSDTNVTGNRLRIAADGLRMWKEHPLLGFGLGTFATVYPRYRSFTTELFVNNAHNDYLQLLVETGLLGFVALLWFLARVYRNAFAELHHSTGELRISVLAALVGLTGIVVHSLFDSNLQVPANAVLFFLLCALATNQQRTRFYVPRQAEAKYVEAK